MGACRINDLTLTSTNTKIKALSAPAAPIGYELWCTWYSYVSCTNNPFNITKLMYMSMSYVLYTHTHAHDVYYNSISLYHIIYGCIILYVMALYVASLVIYRMGMSLYPCSISLAVFHLFFHYHCCLSYHIATSSHFM